MPQRLPTLPDHAPDRYRFFLGGRDLEMVTIRRLLEEHSARVIDHQLAWGARASAYFQPLREALNSGDIPVLVELELDVPQPLIAGAVVVDHHGPAAGRDRPTALEQVFQLLRCSEVEWTRDNDLVVANDRGHIRGMLRLQPPATVDEIRDIRQRDFAAQGVTDTDFDAARQAALGAELHGEGRLTVVRTECRAGLVAEMLERFFGGPGYENLLVLGARQVAFFGEGKWVQRLSEISPASPSSWFGGELPEFGFWGAIPESLEFNPLERLESWLSSNSGGDAAPSDPGSESS